MLNLRFKFQFLILLRFSGAAQHVSGIKGSGFIVAINTDPMAAIFNLSDICIVEDLATFIPVLLEKMAKPKKFPK